MSEKSSVRMPSESYLIPNVESKLNLKLSNNKESFINGVASCMSQFVGPSGFSRQPATNKMEIKKPTIHHLLISLTSYEPKKTIG